MATKNIVPRADGEGGIGTSAKRWLNGFIKNMTVDASMNVPTVGDSENSTKAASTAWVENVFFAKLVTKLAASTAASISSLNTSSLFYRMLSWALTASGVQYNFTNSAAWYICFGSLLGGLIIQGGLVLDVVVPANGTADSAMTAWPIAFTSSSTIKGISGLIQYTPKILTSFQWSSTQQQVKFYNVTSEAVTARAAWVAFAK